MALVTCALFFIASPSSVGAQDIELKPQVEGATQVVDVSTPTFTPVEADGTAYWQVEFDQWPGSRNLRLHFASITVPSSFRGKLVLSDRSGRIVDTYEGDSLVTAQDMWSKIVPGDYALLSLISDKPPTGFSAKVDSVAFTSNEGVALSIIGASELQDVDEYAHDPAVSTVSRSVAKLSFVRNGRQYTCTGFLYGKNTLMTNEHCVNSREICRSTIATFHYQLENGTIDRGTQYRCKSFIFANDELDFAQLQLDGNPGDQWGTLQLSSDDVYKDEPLMIVQHPGGRPKMISRINCVPTQAIADGIRPQSDFPHTCDTEHGSSGSPVLTTAGQVVGLHHFGVAEGPYWNENRAVRMQLIMKEMK
ncbi:trypsin-like serine peptidase [Sinorhizobium fredii]|uniref:trypsin-like serine peptidase n=1 Tax=Rhizobium fredii TaxID=380 RepID=UPI0035133D11